MLKIAGMALVAAVATVQGARGQDAIATPIMSLSLAEGPRTVLATVGQPARPAAPATRPAATPVSMRDVDARVTIEPPPAGEITYMSSAELRTGLGVWLNDPGAIPSTQVREDVAFIRSAAMDEGTGFFDALGNFFDMPEDDERPWSRTMAVHLLAGSREVGAVVPFAALAREEGALQDRERLGVGGGMAYYVAPSASIATEMLYFGERGNSGNAWDRETRWSLRFQWEF